MRYAPGIDYTGSFDNAKEDPELNYGNTDTYKSTYNRVALTNNFLWTFPKVKAVKGIELNTSANAQFDRLTRRKLVAPQRYMIVPSTTGANMMPLSFLKSMWQIICRMENRSTPLSN